VALQPDRPAWRQRNHRCCIEARTATNHLAIATRTWLLRFPVKRQASLANTGPGEQFESLAVLVGCEPAAQDRIDELWRCPVTVSRHVVQYEGRCDGP